MSCVNTSHFGIYIMQVFAKLWAYMLEEAASQTSHSTQYAVQQCTAPSTKAAMSRAVHRQHAALTFGDLLWLRWAVIIANTRQRFHTGTSLALDTAGHHLKANYLHSSDQP